MVEVRHIDQWLADREARVPGLRPGCAKRVIWHGQPGRRTAVSVVYVHGFSATGEELRPMPDLVARALGANLFLTRLAGHGQDGAAMAGATLREWQADVAEAFSVGHALAEQVIVVGCSTGCPLITLALAEGHRAQGVVFVSPNFGLRHRLAQFLLDAPGARRWGHLVAGRERAFVPINAAHEAFWTTRYPIGAVYPMGDAVRAARQTVLGDIVTPLLCAMNEGDQVISPRRAEAALERWGGPVTRYDIRQTAADDAMGHVMAGDIFSPGQTDAMAAAITNWAKVL